MNRVLKIVAVVVIAGAAFVGGHRWKPRVVFVEKDKYTYNVVKVPFTTDDLHEFVRSMPEDTDEAMAFKGNLLVVMGAHYAGDSKELLDDTLGPYAEAETRKVLERMTSGMPKTRGLLVHGE